MLNKVRVERKDLSGERFYYVHGDPDVEGEPLPSVTTVLNVINKPGLTDWSVRTALAEARACLENLSADYFNEWGVSLASFWAGLEPERVRQRAADFGTRVHSLIEDFLNRRFREVPPDLVPPFTAFLRWWGTAGLTPMDSEVFVYHPRLKYAGTLDLLASRKGSLVVVDFKTSNHLWPEYALQVSAYAHAYEALYGQKVHEALVVRLDKRYPIFEVSRISYLDSAFTAFSHALALWRSFRRVRALFTPSEWAR